MNYYLPITLRSDNLGYSPNEMAGTIPDSVNEDLSGPGCRYLRPELRDLKVIGVEEHVTFPQLMARISKEEPAQHANSIFAALNSYSGFEYTKTRISNGGQQRIKDMDEGQIAMQILSLAGPVNTTHVKSPEDALEIARMINDELQKVVVSQPTRFAALAELPFQAPQLAIAELRRCVSELGFVGAMLCGSVAGTGKFLDDPEFDSVLSAFEELDVPLYLHPGIAPAPVVDSYYTIPDQPVLTANLACAGWGWHNEVAIHVIRLAVTGTLERHPRLKIVVGHQGEMLPMMLQRFDQMFDYKAFGLRRSVGETLRRQVWIAISGLFSIPPTLIAVQTWGVDRVLFANDYPFIDAQRVPEFLRAMNDVIAPTDMRKICQTNAESLFRVTA